MPLKCAKIMYTPNSVTKQPVNKPAQWSPTKEIRSSGSAQCVTLTTTFRHGSHADMDNNIISNQNC